MTELAKTLTHERLPQDAKQFMPPAALRRVEELTLYFRHLLPKEWPDDSKMDRLKPFIYAPMSITLQYDVYYKDLQVYRELGAKLYAYEQYRDRVRLPEVEREFNAFQSVSRTGNRLLDRLYDRLFQAQILK